MRATRRRAAVSSATMPTSATYFALCGGAIWESELARIAAVAESAATTRWRDEPKTANRITGSSTVYSPVTTGVPAMRV